MRRPARYINQTDGPLAQLARAPARHAGGHWFKSSTAHCPRQWDRGLRTPTSVRFSLRRRDLRRFASGPASIAIPAVTMTTSAPCARICLRLPTPVACWCKRWCERRCEFHARSARRNRYSLVRIRLRQRQRRHGHLDGLGHFQRFLIRVHVVRQRPAGMPHRCLSLPARHADHQHPDSTWLWPTGAAGFPRRESSHTGHR